MNRLRIYIVFVLSLLAISSCVKDEKDIFGESSTKRINSVLNEYEKLLTEASNGWVLAYYPEDSKYGGFNLYLTFSKEGEVTITSECPLLSKTDEKSVSQYKLKPDMGPVLSFDTYNKILHQLSDPNPDGMGYEGDYEFVILKADENKFELKGKKRGIKMEMTRLSEGITWKEYSSPIDTMIKKFPGFTMRLNVNGTIIDTEESDGIGRYLTFKLPEGVSSSAKGIAYVYTSTGIKFKEPVTIAGKTMQNFVASADKTLLTCTDESVDNVQIVQMPLAEAFVSKKGNWIIDPERMGDRYKDLWNNLVTSLDTKGNEELIYVYLRGYYGTLSLISYSRNDEQAWPAHFYMDFEPVEGNFLRMSCPGGGDEMAGYFYYDYFKYLLSYMSHYNPYAMEYNNLKVPNEITFRRLGSPNKIWFVVTR